MKYVLIFLLMFFIDAIWALYIRSISKDKPFISSLCSAIIVAITAFVVLSYYEDKTYIIPSVLGAFFGTYVMVLYNRRKFKKEK